MKGDLEKSWGLLISNCDPNIWVVFRYSPPSQLTKATYLIPSDDPPTAPTTFEHNREKKFLTP